MYLDYLLLAAPPAALLITMAAQLAATRAFPRWGFLRVVLAGFVTGLVGLLALHGLAWHIRGGPWQEAVALLLVNLGTYAALTYCFIAGFVNLGQTSLRIRIFRELLQSKSGLTLKQLLSQYDSRVIVELRLARLLANQQVVERDGRYFLSGALIWFVATVVRSAKLLVLGRTGEFRRERKDDLQGREAASETLPPP